MSTAAEFASALLRASSRAYAAAALRHLRDSGSAPVDRLPATFADPLADTEARILQIAESLAVERPRLLAGVLRWYRSAFAARGVADSWLPDNLRALQTTFEQELPAAYRGVVLTHVDAALRETGSAVEPEPSLLATGGPWLDTARRYLLAVLEGRGDDAVGIARGMLAAGAPIAAVHDDLLTVTQREVGRMWLHGEIPIADEHFGTMIAGRVLEMLHEHLPPLPADAPRVLALAAGGNLHDIGLRIVAQRLQADGWRVVSLGANMPADDLEWYFADRDVDLVAISVSMALHLSSAKRAVAMLRALPRPPRVLLGGEPFALCPDLHLVLGADASAGDAAAAVTAARRLRPDQRRAAR
ncbi:MAG: cobalamin-dependent protein [Planctomycetes bacterium]|nr:cobalamin-dependent protein [Planctomycetota bacterium]